MPDLAAAWRCVRPPARAVHLDSAAAGRSSYAVLDAVAAHARAEAESGGYVAELAAAPVLDHARAQLGELLGVSAEGVAFLHSATEAVDALLAAWPLPEDGRVAVAPSEWGPNLAAFRARGLAVELLDVLPDGTVDLDALRRRLESDPPDLVHLVRCASHRALTQPVAEAAVLCREAEVALWCDAAQALGHVEAVSEAAATYATSRKWLAGPRGVGVLAVAELWQGRLRVEARQARRPAPGTIPPVRLLEPAEAHVAGRVGLAVAVQEHVDAGPEQVREGLAEVGRRTRKALADVPGWQVVDADDAPGALTALRSTEPDTDVYEARARLLELGLLTTAGAPARAPFEMTGPLLRLSPHLDVTEEDLQRLGTALAAPTSAR